VDTRLRAATESDALDGLYERPSIHIGRKAPGAPVREARLRRRAPG
jgi:hypothetical protein